MRLTEVLAGESTDGVVVVVVVVAAGSVSRLMLMQPFKSTEAEIIIIVGTRDGFFM